MLIPQTAEYALRAMACLAALPPGQAMRARDLAETSNVPMAYLSKVLRRLVLDGLLNSRKGHHGGFSLARPADQITFADVLNAADYQVEPDRCAFGWGSCDLANPCPLHPAYSRLKDAFHGWAGSTSLADVEVEEVARQLQELKAASAR